MLSLCSLPWGTGWEAGTDLNQEMSFFSGIPILLQRANLKKEELSDIFPPLVISKKVLSPQLPTPLWGWALTAGAALLLRHSGSQGNSPFGDSLLEERSHFIRATPLPCAIIATGHTLPLCWGKRGKLMCLASGKALVCDEKRPVRRKRNTEVVLGRPGMLLLYLKKSLTKMVLSCYYQLYGLCMLLEISGMLELLEIKTLKVTF